MHQYLNRPSLRNSLARRIDRDLARAERLVVTPEPVADLRKNKPARFVATLESTGEVIVRSHQPLADSARELLARGYAPTVLLTMRHQGKAYDSFRPAPIGKWAGWTYTESETRPLRRQPWRPHPEGASRMPVAVPTEGQKSGPAPSPGVPGHPELEAAL